MTNDLNSLPLAQFYPQNLLIKSVLTENDVIHIEMRSQTKACNASPQSSRLTNIRKKSYS